jgi:hypothetical protein
MNESDLIGGRPGDADEVFHRERAMVAKAPAAATDELTIVISQFGRRYDFEVPANNWAPGARLPVTGDQCLAIFASDADVWVPVGDWLRA